MQIVIGRQMSSINQVIGNWFYFLTSVDGFYFLFNISGIWTELINMVSLLQGFFRCLQDNLLGSVQRKYIYYLVTHFLVKERLENFKSQFNSNFCLIYLWRSWLTSLIVSAFLYEDLTGTP